MQNLEIKHLDQASISSTQLTIDALARIAPSCITEVKDSKTGSIKHAVDFRVLRQLLGDNAVEDAAEAYQFNWVGKQEARREAAKSINKTLRPVPEDSVDWDNTQNIYIEGDNLEALKLLQKSYLGKVKMIYIDPPYNTGNDFVYHDDFKQSQSEYDEAAGNVDEEGNRLVSRGNGCSLDDAFKKNTDSNGRFHSDWCSMIYSRLMIARSLLTEDGVIFISIDDNEVENLRKICDEVFGEGNFINIISLLSKNTAGASGGGEDKRLKKNLEYILIYAKSYSSFSGFKDVYVYTELSDLIQQYINDGVSWKYTSVITDCGEKEYLCSVKDGNGDDISIYRRKGAVIKSIKELSKQEGISEKETYKKYGKFVFQTTNAQTSIRTRVIEARKDFGITDDLLSIEYTPKSGKNKGKLYEQYYKGDKCRLFVWLKDTSEEIDGVLYKRDTQGTLWNYVGETKNLTKEGGIPFLNGKKPVSLVKDLTKMHSDKDSIIVDFFSGSSTTAHAVIQLNAEDGGKRKFIMVQIPEETDEDSDEFKAGFKNICELGKERIRRAGTKIKEELEKKQAEKANKEKGLFDSNRNGNGAGENKGTKLDTGFRVFRIDSGNMKDVEQSPSDIDQMKLDFFLDNVKDDRTELDLLFGCMLNWGVQLSLPMSMETVDGCNIYTVNEGDLVACLTKDKPVTENIVRAIAEKSPLRVLFRDGSFASDAAKINIFEQFKQLMDWSDDEIIKNVRVL